MKKTVIGVSAVCLALALVLVSMSSCTKTPASSGAAATTAAGNVTGDTAASGNETNANGETVTDASGNPVGTSADAGGSTKSGQSGAATQSGQTTQSGASGQTAATAKSGTTVKGQTSPSAGKATTVKGQTTAATKTTTTTTAPPTPGPYTGIDPTAAAAGKAYYSVNTKPAEQKPTSVTGSTKQFGEVLLTVADNPALPMNIACCVTSTAVSAVVPAGIDVSKLKLSFTYYGKSVSYNGAAAVSSSTVFNCTSPVTLTLSATDGSAKTVALTVQALATGLPSLCVATVNYAAITSTVTFQNGGFYVGGGDKSVCAYAQAANLKTTGQIRGRGTATWAFDKKGYTIQLDSKTSILGLAASKNWSLLAMYQDKSLLRNYTAAYLSAQMGMAFTMHMYPVDLWLNGSYWGTYLLAEKIEVEADRVNITTVSAAPSYDKVGYLLEFDNSIPNLPDAEKAKWTARGPGFYDPVTDEVYLHFTTLGDFWCVVHHPSAKNTTAAHIQFIYDRVNEALTALGNGDYNTINQLIDIESFLKWYLIEEYMDDPQANLSNSGANAQNIYMYRDGGGKLCLGPIWSFDSSSGNNTTYTDAASHPLYGSAWFNKLLQIPQVKPMLKADWTKLNGIAAGLGAYIDKGAAMLNLSQDLNFRKWPILSKPVAGNPPAVVAANTYAKQVSYLKTYLSQRETALNTFFGGL